MPADGYTISTDPARLDVDVIHRYLSGEAYWSRGVPRPVVERAIAGSLCFGLYDAGGAQVGFARVVTDRATFAYLADVFVLKAHRRKGLSKRLMAAAIAHPDLQGLRRWLLATRDAHGLYAQFGFTPLANPERIMERHAPDIYGPTNAQSR
jgi:GNAT superfamily N-acetyltransferase